MRFIHPLIPAPFPGAAGSDALDPPALDLIGAKADGLITLMSLGLPVPAGFVISTEACRAFLRDGRLPESLDAELTAALATLQSGRDQATDPSPPLLVSVRSGAAVSMPGMMDTVLNVTTANVTTAPPVETAPQSETTDETGTTAGPDDHAGPDDQNCSADPAESADLVRRAVREVFASWNTPRAVAYRELHDIPHDLGTAVIVQVMVLGDRDSHSGSGVAFSRDPSTGANVPFGDVLFGSQGGDVVSGRFPTRPLAELADREPAVWAALLAALSRLERHYRDVCHVEFTYESGRLWFLQVRPGGLSGRAAVRAAVDLADEGITDRETALTRVTPWQLHAARIPRIRLDGDITIVGRGIGASPGAADGRIAVTADQAARMATTGPVILVRPHTSPLDVHGMAAAAGIVTTVGGPTSHAAVVARSLGRPAVVGATSLRVDTATGCVDSPAGPLAEGTWITIDGTGGEIVLGRPEIMSGEADPHLARLLSWAAASLA